MSKGTPYINRLQAEITRAYPPPRERAYREQIRLHRAFRESDRRVLRPTGWAKDSDASRDYIIDPLGERFPDVWAGLLYGADPVIAPASKKDAVRMAELIDANDLPSEWQRAEDLVSTEGEVFSRIHPDFNSGHAMIEWHSRLQCVPLWVGKTLVACAFVSMLDRPSDNEIIRYVEIHGEGAVRRLLFRGTANSDTLGEEISLESRPETEEWDRDWEHNLDILVDRVPNGTLGSDFYKGTSDYDGLEDLLLALNELTTVGQENARLTAKQRAIIPQRFLNMAGNFPRGAEILIATEVDQDPEKIKAQVAMVEFEFDAAALIAYHEHLTDVILTRARIAPQLVGRHTEGAQTGPALKARLVDSEMAAMGKGKPWDDRNPKILQKAAQVEKAVLSIAWASVDKLPSFKRSSSLPEDPEALTRRMVAGVNAEIVSRKTAIRLSFPEWDDARVDDEVKQIMKEVGNDAPPPAGDGEIPPPERAERRDGPNGDSRGGRSA